MSEKQVIVDRSRRHRGVFEIGCGTIIGSWAVLCLSALAAVWHHATWGGLISLALGVPLALIAALALRAGFRDVWFTRRRGAPTLTLTEPLSLGGVVVGRFHRVGTSPKDRRIIRLTAELVCTESATEIDDALSKSETKTHVAFRRPLEVEIDSSSGTVAADIMIAVPLAGPPSMALFRNQISWSVQVQVHTSDRNQDGATFPVQVPPIVAPGVTPPLTPPPVRQPAADPGGSL